MTCWWVRYGMSLSLVCEWGWGQHLRYITGRWRIGKSHSAPFVLFVPIADKARYTSRADRGRLAGPPPERVQQGLGLQCMSLPHAIAPPSFITRGGRGSRKDHRRPDMSTHAGPGRPSGSRGPIHSVLLPLCRPFRWVRTQLLVPMQTLSGRAWPQTSRDSGVATEPVEVAAGDCGSAPRPDWLDAMYLEWRRITHLVSLEAHVDGASGEDNVLGVDE